MSDPKPDHRALLEQFLVDSEARCPTCRYALRGCKSPKCPECGSELRLGVMGPVAGNGWWLAAVFGAGLASFASVMLLMTELLSSVSGVLHDPHIPAAVRAGFSSVSALPNWRSLIVLGVFAMGFLLALAGLIGARRAIAGWPRGNQLRICVAGWLSPLVLLGLLSLLTR